MSGPVVRDFKVTELGASYFVAKWHTDAPCHCRIQMSTSRGMVTTVPVNETGQSFLFDSRASGLGPLPPMGHYWLRVLAEDSAGNECASDIVELLLPEGDAISNVRVLPLGHDSAVVEWWSAEPTVGQVCFRTSDGEEAWSGFEPALRTYHYVTMDRLEAGATYQVRIRQGLHREKWGDQFLRSAVRTITMPDEPRASMSVFRTAGDAVCMCHERMRLVADATGQMRIFFAGKPPLTVLEPGSNPFSITLADGTRLSEFADDAAISGPESINTEFGTGMCVQISGSACAPDGVAVRRHIRMEMYPEHAGAVVLRASYSVDGAAKLCIASVDSLCFRLDRRLALRKQSRAEAWQFAAYLPVSNSKNFGCTYTVVQLEPGFKRENSLAGTGDGAQQSCGVPLFDFWCREMGLAIGHLNDCQIPVRFPVNVAPDGRVEIALQDTGVRQICASAPYQSPPLLLVVHDLDFFDPVSCFRKLMAARGLEMPDPPDEAFEPVWSTWGYQQTFRKADILRVVPVLKELGVRWIQFDDPWYSNHGNFDVNQKIFPGGEKDLADFIRRLKLMGFRVRLWICSGHVSSDAPYAQAHPDRLILDSTHKPVEVTGAGAPSGQLEHELCPCVEQNQDFCVAVIEHLLKQFGADAIYQDGIFGCPPCYSTCHGHRNSFETLPAHAVLFKRIYETVRELTAGHGVVMLCTCGKVPDFYLLPYVNRVATADPMPVHVRQRVKSLKALLGPTAAVDYDFVETTLDGFASAVGTGAALYLKFTVPLEPADMARYRKWLAIAREHGLCRGEYLNLYDLAHDFPEAHVVRKGDRLYYGFYASPWAGDNETPYQGQAELRGLAPGVHYKVVDYVREQEMGVFTGPAAALEVSFRGSLLLFAEPAVAPV